MNSTAQLARDPQAHLPTGPTHVASRSARTAAPGAWSPTDRWAWAAGLPVSGIARAVAGCIARHANDQTGLGWPGDGDHRHGDGLLSARRRQGHQGARAGRAFHGGPIQGRQKEHRKSVSTSADGWCTSRTRRWGGSAPRALGSAPYALGGSAPGAPESVSIESVQEPVSSSRAREVCKICGHDWPAEYGTTCYQCGQPTASQRRDQEFKRRNEEAGAEFERELLEPKACTCGTAYHNSYGRLCVDCKGEPSAAQRDALREKDGCRGVDDRVGEDGGVVRPAGPGIDAPPLEAIASTPPRAETETRQPPETRGQRPDSSVSPEDGSPPNGGEPGPNARRFFADFAKWTVGKRTPTQHRSARRRMARTARHELADLAKGEQANDDTNRVQNRSRWQRSSQATGRFEPGREAEATHSGPWSEAVFGRDIELQGLNTRWWRGSTAEEAPSHPSRSTPMGRSHSTLQPAPPDPLEETPATVN